MRERLGLLTGGELVIEAPGSTVRCGQPAVDGLQARIQVHDPAFWRAVALRGSVGAGEAWAAGDWTADDPAQVVRMFARNHEALASLDSGLARFAMPLLRGWDALRRNSRSGARKNIAAHYDLSNEFFQLWLDPTMTYSSGIYERPDATLEESSVAKLDRLARKLRLTADDHLLEIGAGWGSMAMHAAREYGCRVTTTTISKQQHALATQRVKDAGLQGRIEILLEDYRDLQGTYDKIVSIEMIEAIGWRQYPTYFGTLSRLLRLEGLAAIQAITIADQHYERAKRDVDFIKRYIFPGCTIPSINAMAQAAADNGDLRLVHLEDITPHYARTLRDWRHNLYDSADEALALGFDETFLRLWEFYLAYCEGGFEERHIGDVQLLFAKPGDRLMPLLPALEALPRA